VQFDVTKLDASGCWNLLHMIFIPTMNEIHKSRRRVEPTTKHHVFMHHFKTISVNLKQYGFSIDTQTHSSKQITEHAYDCNQRTKIY
jgi:hypothetical protein